MRTLLRWVAATTVQTLFSLIIAGYAMAQCENPDTLTFSIIPTEETIQELIIYKPVIDYLGKITGKKVEFYAPVAYANVIEAMIGKWADVAVLGPYSYVIANEMDPEITVFATYSKNAGHIQEAGPGYKSVLISRKGSRFTTIKSLRGASVGLTDPDSTSGSLVPKVIFTRQIGKSLDEFFRQITYTGGHDLSALAVYEGAVDAAFIATHRLDNAIERGMFQKEDFNYLWQSPVLPQDPFCYRNSLCQDLKNKIVETFLTLHTQPSCAKFFTNINASQFVKVTSKNYDIIRELKNAEDNRERTPSH